VSGLAAAHVVGFGYQYCEVCRCWDGYTRNAFWHWGWGWCMASALRSLTWAVAVAWVREVADHTKLAQYLKGRTFVALEISSARSTRR
jgi:hypothetical protein